MSEQPFDIQDKVAVVTGGVGVLCAAMCRALASARAKVAVLDLIAEAAETLVDEIRSGGGKAIDATCNVLEKASNEAAANEVLVLIPNHKPLSPV